MCLKTKTDLFNPDLCSCINRWPISYYYILSIWNVLWVQLVSAFFSKRTMLFITLLRWGWQCVKGAFLYERGEWFFHWRSLVCWTDGRNIQNKESPSPFNNKTVTCNCKIKLFCGRSNWAEILKNASEIERSSSEQADLELIMEIKFKWNH